MKSIGWSFVRKAGIVLGFGAVLFAAPSVASADILLASYQPGGSPSDLNDLDHHMMYAWKISDGTGAATAPDTSTSKFNNAAGTAPVAVTSAALTFKNLYNWTTEPNMLFLDLLDTSKNISSSVLGWGDSTAPDRNQVTYFTDDTGSTTQQLRDDFLLSGGTRLYGSAPGFLVANTTPSIQLTGQSFLAQGLNPAGTLGTGWSYTNGTSAGLYTYTYTFDASEIGTLNSYIQASTYYDFAIGFDPDCHFFNGGITLDLYTAGGPAGNPAVPEPTSLILLGTGLLVAGRRYRNRRQR